jgi:hypothetical protein
MVLDVWGWHFLPAEDAGISFPILCFVLVSALLDEALPKIGSAAHVEVYGQPGRIYPFMTPWTFLVLYPQILKFHIFLIINKL